MTQLEALDALIAAVSAGETCRVHIERMSAQAGLPEGGRIYGSAYQDDLNAARNVHNALVPEWTYSISEWESESDSPMATVFAPGGRGSVRSIDTMLTARNWLLAALQAYRSTLVAS